MKHYLGIELGSTRIKAMLLNENYEPVSTGDYAWKSTFKNGIWTYDLEEAWTGLRAALKSIDSLEDVCAAGISGMMLQQSYLRNLILQSHNVGLLPTCIKQF